MANKIKDADKQKVREDISNAYAAVKGREHVNSSQAFTFEEALDLQINQIEGEDTTLRPNLLKRVDRIEQDLIKTVSTLKSWPEDTFAKPNEGVQYVNTPEEEELL